MEIIDILKSMLPDNVVLLPPVEESIVKIASKNPSEFLKRFSYMMQIIKELGVVGMFDHAQIERLKQTDGLGSIHIETRTFNSRILFSIESNDTICLYAFEKKAGKRKTEYSNYIPIANSILDKYRKGVYDESKQ